MESQKNCLTSAQPLFKAAVAELEWERSHKVSHKIMPHFHVILTLLAGGALFLSGCQTVSPQRRVTSIPVDSSKKGEYETILQFFLAGSPSGKLFYVEEIKNERKHSDNPIAEVRKWFAPMDGKAIRLWIHFKDDLYILSYYDINNKQLTMSDEVRKSSFTGPDGCTLKIEHATNDVINVSFSCAAHTRELLNWVEWRFSIDRHSGRIRYLGQGMT